MTGITLGKEPAANTLSSQRLTIVFNMPGLVAYMGPLLIAGLILQIVLLSLLDAGEATANTQHARPKSFLKATDSSRLKTSESRYILHLSSWPCCCQ